MDPLILHQRLSEPPVVPCEIHHFIRDDLCSTIYRHFSRRVICKNCLLTVDTNIDKRKATIEEAKLLTTGKIGGIDINLSKEDDPIYYDQYGNLVHLPGRKCWMPHYQWDYSEEDQKKYLSNLKYKWKGKQDSWEAAMIKKWNI